MGRSFEQGGPQAARLQAAIVLIHIMRRVREVGADKKRKIEKVGPEQHEPSWRPV
jgi:hypothetical protein